MRILSLKRDKKHCCKAELSDGRIAFIDIDVCSEYCLKADTELTGERLTEILRRSDYVRAKERALWYLDRADRTEKGLFNKLREAGFAAESCAKVLAFLKEYGLIDDRRYAAHFAERYSEQNVSKREIRRKLYGKGISRELCDEVLSRLPDDEHSQIRAVIEKKYSGKLNDKNSVQKVYAALIRKGFSFSSVREVLKQYSEDLQYSEEY